MASRRVVLLLGNVGLMVALAGCAGGSTVRVPERVEVPVPVACIPAEDVPARPTTRTEADLLGMDRYRRTLAAWSDLVKLQGYSAALEALVAGCSRVPP